MPSEHPVTAIHEQQPLEQSQIKLCSACHCPLADASAALGFLINDSNDTSDTSIVCGSCRTRFAPPTPRVDALSAQEMERELRRRAATLQGGRNEAAAFWQEPAANHTIETATLPCPDHDNDMGSPASTPPSSARPDFVYLRAPPSAPSESVQAPSISVSVRPALSPIDTKTVVTHQPSRPSHATEASSGALVSAGTSKARTKAPQTSSPDPLVDITRIRMRSQGHHCLYPGATFQGTQKSGRNSYDVNVTIVDVDFSASHLCGYLRIRGLTDDWPELTTYFDAEIIGSRYGFLTRNWGASEQEDMVHWARFPAFRHVRHELKKPHLTMKDANRGAVFMRWKEKFLVPDHRVQDINGASFAGFYYVCVDFNPQQSGSASAMNSQPLATSETLTHLPSSPQSGTKPEFTPRSRRMSTGGPRRIARSQSRGFHSPPVATMSGFYFHQNSEPYQQLSLVHAPEHTTSCFEFR
ncbi:hypothetical protein WOLCODRAFT_23147 [Wolfiporia cocos MD-104 SS10]|uniref:Vacuolar import and degradation protein n=1 Tax=Wolfiporia cocos (strain MD-104) TaxID=742152 RepID=A0A2H3JEF6_WOLCO|nr:hypothetical protein WOLCODRAFT_23147 [Wolfiporia cocos MD-104 SS10]